MSRAGASWLQVDDVAGPGDHRWVVRAAGPQYGLHPYDELLAYGNLMALVRAETAGAAFIVLHLVPMGRVVELIDLAGMNERLERKHRLRTLWNRGWLFAATN